MNILLLIIVVSVGLSMIKLIVDEIIFHIKHKRRIKELEKFAVRMSEEDIKKFQAAIEEEDRLENLKNIKLLREKTSASVALCAEALEESDGDIDKATSWLKQKGVKPDVKQRATKEGVIISYQHMNRKLVSTVELRCETDFVAKSDRFQAFALDLAMHVAGTPTTPIAIDREGLSEKIVEAEKRDILNQPDMANKPEKIKEKIIEGRLTKFYKEKVLLDQPFIKDENHTIKQLVDWHINTLGENIRVVGFSCWTLGNKPIVEYEEKQ